MSKTTCIRTRHGRGHANIAITLDRYGHLMPGNEDEAADLLDAYLARANTAQPLSMVDAAG